MQNSEYLEKKAISINNYLYSNINLDIFVGNTIGNRCHMQDFYYIDEYKELIIISLADGHGGSDISNNLSKNLNILYDIVLLFDDKLVSKKIFEKKINKFFLYLDNKFKKFKNQGSTLSIVILSTKYIYHINLGDSNMVYVKNNSIIHNSIIHRPNNKSESLRIKKSYDITNNRIDSSLSFSRSIGDYKYKIYNDKYDGILSAISVIPSINYFNRLSDSYIIFSTDGFHDFIDINNVINILNKHTIDNQIINKLINYTIQKGSNDNITLIIIKIK
uniref:PPM-type phosphatase domain-containing protein n=1 Tax=viral metagenome TaxID=1070528 RepID=A0A6C0IVZ5_9ZZZZ